MFSGLYIGMFLILFAFLDLLFGAAAGVITLAISILLSPLLYFHPIFHASNFSLVIFIKRDEHKFLYWLIVLTELIAGSVLLYENKWQFSFYFWGLFSW